VFLLQCSAKVRRFLLQGGGLRSSSFHSRYCWLMQAYCFWVCFSVYCLWHVFVIQERIAMGFKTNANYFRIIRMSINYCWKNQVTFYYWFDCRSGWVNNILSTLCIYIFIFYWRIVHPGGHCSHTRWINHWFNKINQFEYQYDSCIAAWIPAFNTHVKPTSSWSIIVQHSYI